MSARRPPPHMRADWRTAPEALGRGDRVCHVSASPQRGEPMHTIEFEIIDFRSPEEAENLARHMRGTKGVAEASATFAPGSLIVRYDPHRVTPPELETAVLDCREHCKGSFVIAHICAPTVRR